MNFFFFFWLIFHILGKHREEVEIANNLDRNFPNRKQMCHWLFNTTWIQKPWSQSCCFSGLLWSKGVNCGGDKSTWAIRGVKWWMIPVCAAFRGTHLLWNRGYERGPGCTWVNRLCSSLHWEFLAVRAVCRAGKQHVQLLQNFGLVSILGHLV